MIDQPLIDRLIPEILNLQAQSRDPISVYIDSVGGSVLQAEVLLLLLKASSQDFAPPCRIITTVTSFAASAAADLLAFGDYAIAFPQSTIHYHGVRTIPEHAITAETASGLLQSLKLNNDRYALELAARSNHRFIFLYFHSRHGFPHVRRELAEPELSDLDCFLHILSSNLSEEARAVVERARQLFARYTRLSAAVFGSRRLQKLFKEAGPASPARIEAALLKFLVDYEWRHGSPSASSFRTDGIAQVVEDFYLFTEFVGHAGDGKLQNLCERWAPAILSPEEEAEIAAAPPPDQQRLLLDRLRPVFQPLWLFFVALCHSLQTGENTLSARDAYWLGLVDEVLGDPDLPSVRLLVEFQPDPSAAP